MHFTSRAACVVACTTMALAACSKLTARNYPAPSPNAPAASATLDGAASATIRDASGKEVGTAMFTDTYAGVLVSATVGGLGLGAHAVHIHAVGKCEPPFTSAGGHFNPEGRHHGYKSPAGPHLGDMPNIDTPAAGQLRFEFLLPGTTLRGTNALLGGAGTAIVVHAARDDYTTDPAGNAGGRIACGVITGR